MPKLRAPSHAGSWYSDSSSELGQQIDKWMAQVQRPDGFHARAIIAPHAGYSYCGHVMAYAYKMIDPTKVKRVFLLGPSHHVYTTKCCLSSTDAYDTPLGSMTIDQGVYAQLRATGAFEEMDVDTDEAEHSLELHTPYIVRALAGRAFTLVPIMVGSLSGDSEARYGKLLAPYLDDPANLFILSSDFCHWGRRFSYQWHDEGKGPIWQAIRWLDHEGMAAIETGEAAAFAQYQAQYRNTICGRHPIGVFLNMLPHASTKFEIKFRHYDQSSKCESKIDSSVSYAAATAAAL